MDYEYTVTALVATALSGQDKGPLTDLVGNYDEGNPLDLECDPSEQYPGLSEEQYREILAKNSRNPSRLGL